MDYKAIFQSTPPVKAATVTPRSEREKLKISIHAAREGGDIVIAVARNAGIISIHAAREGGDSNRLMRLNGASRFQSTPPVKAATSNDAPVSCASVFQSTPPVKAATCCTSQPIAVVDISIHAAREGGDTIAVSSS